LKRKIKFFTLYDTFSEAEKKQFKLFITSHLFSRGRKYTRILKYIEIDRTVFFEFGNTIKERTLWNRLSELTKLAEKFLVLKAAESETAEYNKLLLSELKKRNLNDYYEKKINDYRSELENALVKEMRLEEYLNVNSEYFNYLNSLPDSKITGEQFLRTNDFKFSLFILGMLDFLIQIEELKKVKSLASGNYLEEILLKFNFSEILKFIKENVSDIYPLVAFHFHIYNSMKEPLKQTHYKKAKKIFENDLTQIPENYRMNFYNKLIYINLDLINLQETSHYTELFRLINSKLKEGLFSDIEDKNFDKNEFRNYILVALSLKKYKWIENFIDKFGSKLPAEFRDDSIYFGNALLLYHKKEYLQSLELLNKLKKTNPYFYIDASRLKLKVSYDLNQIDDCYIELRRIMEFMRQDRKVQFLLIKYTKEFCRSYRLLLNLKQNPTKKNLLNLEFELNKGKLAGRRWIKKKISEIKIDSKL